MLHAYSLAFRVAFLSFLFSWLVSSTGNESEACRSINLKSVSRGGGTRAALFCPDSGGAFKCRPGGSRTLDVVRPVSLSNAFFFFIPHRKLKVGAASSPQSREKEGHVLDFTASLCCAVAVSLLQWK